jgi:hypothetical protein
VNPYRVPYQLLQFAFIELLTRHALRSKVCLVIEPDIDDNCYQNIPAFDAISTIQGVTRILTRCVASRRLSNSSCDAIT